MPLNNPLASMRALSNVCGRGKPNDGRAMDEKKGKKEKKKTSIALRRPHNPSSIAGTEEGAAWDKHSSLAQSSHGQQRQLVQEMQDRAVEAGNRDDEGKEKQDKTGRQLTRSNHSRGKNRPTRQQNERKWTSCSGGGRAGADAIRRDALCRRGGESCRNNLDSRGQKQLSAAKQRRQRGPSRRVGRVVEGLDSWSLAGLLTSNF